MFTSKIFATAGIADISAMMIGMRTATVPYTQTAVAAHQGGIPNDSASEVAKPRGATSNKEFFQTCKESNNTASDCAHYPNQLGKYIRKSMTGSGVKGNI